MNLKKRTMIALAALFAVILFVCVPLLTACGESEIEKKYAMSQAAEASETELSAFAGKISENGLAGQAFTATSTMFADYSASSSAGGMSMTVSQCMEIKTEETYCFAESGVSAEGSYTMAYGKDRDSLAEMMKIGLVLVDDTAYLNMRMTVLNTTREMKYKATGGSTDIDGAMGGVTTAPGAGDIAQIIGGESFDPAQFRAEVSAMFEEYGIEVSPKVYIDGNRMKIVLNDSGSSFFGIIADDEGKLTDIDIVLCSEDLSAMIRRAISGAGVSGGVSTTIDRMDATFTYSAKATSAKVIVAPADADEYVDVSTDL